MNDNDMNKIAMDYIFEQSDRISKKMLEIITDENKNELNEVSGTLRRLIHDNALFTLIKLMNFPKSIMSAADEDEDFLEKYEDFSESFRSNLSEMCNALYNWEPK